MNRSMRRLLAAGLVAALVGAASPARAIDDDPDVEVARRHFNTGRGYYEASDYSHALEEFEAARRAKALPALDFNIARCLDRLERYREAIAAYERFIAGTPDPFDAQEARERVLVLKARLPVLSEREAQVIKLIDQGSKLFNANDLNAAKDSFEQARRLLPDKATPYRWLGLVEARQGHCAEAIARLDVFLGRVPRTDVRVAEALTLRDRCREEIQPRMGRVRIESTPPGAEVRLDDEAAAPAGRTPLGRDLAEGAHVAFLRLPGYATLSKGFTVARSRELQIEVELRPREPEGGSPETRIAPEAKEAPAAPSGGAARFTPAIVVGAAAVALAASGAGLLFGSVKPDYDAIAALPCAASGTCDPAAVDVAGPKMRQLVALSLLGAGGAAALVDVVLWIVEARHGREREATPSAFRIHVAPAPSGIVAGGTF